MYNIFRKFKFSKELSTVDSNKSGCDFLFLLLYLKKK